MSESTEQFPPLPYDIYAHHGRQAIQRFNASLRAARGSRAPLPNLRTLSALTITDAPAIPLDPVGILGAGAAGLYAALILEDLGIPYQILEAQGRVGGRLFTYEFKDQLGAPYNYFDIGAMRFPKIPAMERAFRLFNYPPLNSNGIALSAKLNPYYYTSAGNNSFLDYNNVTVRRNAVPPSDPFFGDQVIKDISDSDPYIQAGTSAIVDDVIRPFATRLLDDLANGTTTGWEYLRTFDLYSARSYMALKYTPTAALALPPTSLSSDVINWIETFDNSTGSYDFALSEMVLDAVAFGWQPDEHAPPTDWFCIDGGAQQIAGCMSQYIQSKNPTAIKLNKRVTSIAYESDYAVNVTTSENVQYKFSNVISTIPLPVMRTIDLSGARLSVLQSNALRQLKYGPSVKVGMQFKTAWWTTATDLSGQTIDIVGGASYTDRPIRTVVYPSFGDPVGGKTTTLIASYTWTDDADRLGALVDMDNNQPLIDLMIRDLAAVHNLSIEFLNDQLLECKGWSWSHDPYTMGAFAYFGPGQFNTLYTSLNSPAGEGFIHFASEALSVRHAWVVGAFDSAWEAVYEILLQPPYRPLLQKFFQNWGINAEWTKQDVGRAPETDLPEGRKGGPAHMPGPIERIPKVELENSLMLEHLALTHPNLFA